MPQKNRRFASAARGTRNHFGDCAIVTDCRAVYEITEGLAGPLHRELFAARGENLGRLRIPAYDALRTFDRIAASQSDLDSRIMPQTRDQFGAGAFGDEPARIDNPNPRAKTLRFLHVVRGVENRGARVAQALHQIEDRATALRVDADCRLIQDQELRSMQNSAREIQASLHPARIGADDVVGARRETHRVRLRSHREAGRR
jgi:hypothetical protein